MFIYLLIERKHERVQPYLMLVWHPNFVSSLTWNVLGIWTKLRLKNFHKSVINYGLALHSQRSGAYWSSYATHTPARPAFCCSMIDWYTHLSKFVLVVI